MNKYLMTGIAALALSATFTSCSHNDDFEEWSQAKADKAQYAQTFLNYVGGKIAENQAWGFTAGTTRGLMTRSVTAPAVPSMTAPYDEAWVTNYNLTATEPNSQNIYHNHDNSNEHISYNVIIDYSDPQQVAERKYVYGEDGNQDTPAQRLAWAKENHPDWVVVEKDEDYVLNYKITGTWDGDINVAGSEGIIENGTLSHSERTIVVTGTWNITVDQRIGSLGKIIIANGGTVNVAAGKTLNMVNQAQLVVLRGGTLTGAGKVEVNNGNASGLENYNGGTISVATFNNNFGKFFNYGDFLVNEYQGGAQESNFYNRHLAVVDHFAGTGSTANARIFNACQFYVVNNARIRNYEGVSGSALIVGGQLMCSSSEDGTSTPTYVGLAAGALVKAGSLYNNGTSWTGPTEGGYAVLSIGKFDFMNWEQDHPELGGYFINNIYLQADDLNNVPDGNGYHQTDPTDAVNYSYSIAEYKFKNIVANAGGNGNVTIINKGTTEILPADPEFELGVKGCTPGFKGQIPSSLVYDLRVIGEDLSANNDGDFDFNDVVFDVKFDANNAYIKLLAAGGTLPLRIDGKDIWEVHKLFGVDQDYMVNTNAKKQNLKGNERDKEPIEFRLGRGINDASEANSIKIEVYKNGNWLELEAPIGEPAAKLAVGIDFNWLDERTSIKGTYTNFVTWARDNHFQSRWWDNTVE